MTTSSTPAAADAAAATPAPAATSADSSNVAATAASAAGAPVIPGMAVDGKAPPEPSSLLGTKPEDAKAPDAKPAEAKPADAKPADAKPAEAPVYDLKFPEEFKVNDEQVSEFKALATEHKLPPEAAQKFADLYVKAVTEAAIDAPQRAWRELQNSWQTEIKADPEFGGEKLGPALASISKAIDLVGGKDARAIREAFDMTGAGNNPAIVRFMARLSRGANEGGPVAGNPSAGKAGRSAAEVLYPPANPL